MPGRKLKQKSSNGFLPRWPFQIFPGVPPQTEIERLNEMSIQLMREELYFREKKEFLPYSFFKSWTDAQLRSTIKQLEKASAVNASE